MSRTMRFSRAVVILSLLCGFTFAKDETCDRSVVPPMVSPRWMNHGQIIDIEDDAVMEVADVFGCCVADQSNVLSPTLIGRMPQMKEDHALEILGSAKEAWKGGSGIWPQLSLLDRIKAIQDFVSVLKKQRTAMIDVLMWEIGKNHIDAAAEFDRTMQFIEKLIETIYSHAEFNADWQSMGGNTNAFVRRAAIGIILCLGPYNYPLNETYATLIPALLMGNIVIMKIPTVGGLVHLLTMDAFSQTLPKGTIHFISGSGRMTMPPLMKTGIIDGLAFIGGSKAADELIRQHPAPHRLKLFLQLEAKNMAIFLPDVFEDKDLLDTALNEAIAGTTSYNGQRCTALKLLFVPSQHANVFLELYLEKVNALQIGLPWQTHGDGITISHITPLPNVKRVHYMKELIEDAISMGAKVVNNNGGNILGGPNSTLMVPAVLYPVTSNMKVYHEEQFGPVIPIAPYDDIETVIAYGRDGVYGQQVSIFTSGSEGTATSLLDLFSHVFGKININAQCGRSPDNLVFSGRRSSAMGTMSVKHALQEFSVPTAVVYKGSDINQQIVSKIQTSSKFLKMLSESTTGR